MVIIWQYIQILNHVVHLKLIYFNYGLIKHRYSKEINLRAIKAVYFHCAHLTYMKTVLCEMPGWMKHKLESRLPGNVSIASDKQMTSLLWQEAKRTKEPCDESERAEWKPGLKFNIQKT